MYNDKDKQKESNKQAQQGRRELVREGTTDEEGMTDKEIDGVYQGMSYPENVIPKPDTVIPDVIPKPKDVGITFDGAGDVYVPDKVFTKLMTQAKPGHIRVSKPGDADYRPLCAFTRQWQARK